MAAKKRKRASAASVAAKKGWATRRAKEAERLRKLEAARRARAAKKKQADAKRARVPSKRSTKTARPATSSAARRPKKKVSRAERARREHERRSEAAKKSWRTRRGGEEVKKRLAVMVRLREEGKESRDIKHAHEVYYDAKQDLRASTTETEYMRILRRISESLRLDRLGWDILY